MSARILIVDDAPQIRRVLKAALIGAGYEVATAASGEEGLEVFAEWKPQLVILDMALPGIGGVEVCRRIRTAGATPVLILSVREGEAEKIKALDAGADDYVTKPFGSGELLARIRSLLRRTTPLAAEGTLKVGSLEIDFDRRTVSGPQGVAKLTPKEYELLRFMAAHEGRVLTHRTLLQNVWGPDYGEETEYLRVLINQLRRKIEVDPANPQMLLTEPWVGYRFSAP